MIYSGENGYPMRLMQIATFYPAYLSDFYNARPGLAGRSTEEQVNTLLEDGFGAGHMIGPYMRDRGYEVEVVIANNLASQAKWMDDRGLRQPTSEKDLLSVTAIQIDTFRPDILYVLDPVLLDSQFLSALTHKPKLVVGWRAAPIPPTANWTGYDLILSSDQGYREEGLAHGARHAAIYAPGFSRKIAARVADTPKSSDVVFCGQITGHHPDRIHGLTLLAQHEAHTRRTLSLHLGIRPHINVPQELRQLDRGALWGMDMYRAIRAGRIALNFHINAASNRGQNMRLFETTGIGSFMLTEADPNLRNFFTPGREVETFRDVPEFLEKIEYYLEHEKEREDIARQGHERCLSEHSMEARTVWLDEIFRRDWGAASKSTYATPKSGIPSNDLDFAETLIQQGQIAEAADFLNQFIQRTPRNARALTLLARIATAVGQHDRAQELLETARRIEPTQSPQAGIGTAGMAEGDILRRTFPDVTFGHDVQCLGVASTRIGRGSCIGDGAWINVNIRDGLARMVIGENVLIGRRGMLSSGTALEIGAFTIFGPNVYVASAEHQYDGNHLKPILQTGIRDYGSLVIEENCWLGVNSVVTGGITIGRGSVIGANTVVRQSLPPFAVAVGSPARIVRMFNPVTAMWEPVKSPTDEERIMQARQACPLPAREAFLAQLRIANQGRTVIPIVAGRGEHML